MLRPIRGLLAALVLYVMTAAATAQDTTSAAVQREPILALLTRVETAFSNADAKGLAACWTPTGEFIGPAGASAEGRENIEKLFQDAFADHKQAKLMLHPQRFRVVNDSLALVDAIAEVKPPAATGGTPMTSFVVVKKDGQWLIESAHETMAHLPPQANHLKDLQWLVGEWASATSPAGVTLHANCDWTTNQAFLIRKFKAEGKELFLHGGTEVVGWDPRSESVHSWVFDSDGGFGENAWVRDGNRWLIKYTGTLADGSQAQLHAHRDQSRRQHDQNGIERPHHQRRGAARYSRSHAQAASNDGPAGEGRRRGHHNCKVNDMQSTNSQPSSSVIPSVELPVGAVVLTATIKALAGQESVVRAALLDLVAPSRDEPGCICYNLHEVAGGAGPLHLLRTMGRPGCFRRALRDAALPRPGRQDRRPHRAAGIGVSNAAGVVGSSCREGLLWFDLPELA